MRAPATTQVRGPHHPRGEPAPIEQHFVRHAPSGNVASQGNFASVLAQTKQVTSIPPVNVSAAPVERAQPAQIEGSTSVAPQPVSALPVGNRAHPPPSQAQAQTPPVKVETRPVEGVPSVSHGEPVIAQKVDAPLPKKEIPSQPEPSAAVAKPRKAQVR